MNIKEFIGSLPEQKSEVIMRTFDPSVDINSLPWDERLKLVGKEYVGLRLRADNGSLFVGRQEVGVVRRGRNIFYTSRWSSSISVRDNRLTVKDATYDEMKRYLDFLGIVWCRDLSSTEFGFICRPAILRRVFTGKIHSQETLWKSVSSICFHAKDIPWKVMRDFFLVRKNCPEPSLSDLLAFTKTPSVTLKVYTDLQSEYVSSGYASAVNDHIRLLNDAIQSAVNLDEKVDASWSVKRLRSEHSRQIQEEARRRYGSMTDTDIFPTAICDDGIRMLNTEKAVFVEGCTMNHCVYTHYFDSIRAHRLLVFHMSWPEDCTFSVEKRKGAVEIQQIHLAHNGYVQEGTRERAERFVRGNSQTLFSLLDGYGRYDEDCDLPF